MIYCLGQEFISHRAGGYDWGRVSLSDVREALREQDSGFFDFIGESYNDVMARLKNNDLAPEISSLNGYSGYFTQSAYWDFTVQDMIFRVSKR